MYVLLFVLLGAQFIHGMLKPEHSQVSPEQHIIFTVTNNTKEPVTLWATPYKVIHELCPSHDWIPLHVSPHMIATIPPKTQKYTVAILKSEKYQTVDMSHATITYTEKLPVTVMLGKNKIATFPLQSETHHTIDPVRTP